MNFRHIIFVSIITLISSCIKEDKIIKLPKTSGDTRINSVNLGRDYTTQLFYNLNNDSTWQNDYRIWDLGFENSLNGYHIILNGGKEVQIQETKNHFYDTNFVIEPNQWKWDNPSEINLDLAFNNWNDTNACDLLNPLGHSRHIVYIVDRGSTEVDRYKKLIIEAVDYSAYIIRYSNLDNSNLIELIVPKLANKNYIYCALNSQGSLLDIEPAKNKWDVLFTRYRHIYYDMIPVTPYQVTGLLLNPYNVSVARDSIIGFDNITIDNAIKLDYHREKDFIGFNWKHYNFSTARYEVRTNLTYIVKSISGYYLKLRFTDFYDENGIKGCPKFEIKRL